MSIVLLVIWIIVSFFFGIACGKKIMILYLLKLTDIEWAAFVIAVDSMRNKLRKEKNETK